MNIYSLYEFPPTTEKLYELLNEIDELQPISYKDGLNVVNDIIGKRPSRTKITLKNLIKLGFLEGNEQISLTWEAQLYLDTKKNISGLILYLLYKIPELFMVCEDICKIDKEFLLSNPKLLNKLWEQNYEIEPITTAKEKIYALKRLIKCCKEEVVNPFEEYRGYVKFLNKLQEVYLSMTSNRIGVAVTIMDLKGNMNKNAINEKEFDLNFFRLYYDPIYATYTSFTSVISDFAYQKYYYIDKESYYYFKLTNYFFEI